MKAILTGDTYRFREILKAHKWQWEPARRAWTMEADWESAQEVIRTVRGYSGIRNRGDLYAELASSEHREEK